MSIDPTDLGHAFTEALEGEAGVRGLVSFKGYLDPIDETRSRLYYNDTARGYLEIVSTDIKAQVDVPANPTDLRSVVYVDERATIVKCQRMFAHDINQDSLDTDPGGATGGHPPWR